MKAGVLRCGDGAKAGGVTELRDYHESLPVLEILSLVTLTVSTFLCTACLTLQMSSLSVFS